MNDIILHVTMIALCAQQKKQRSNRLIVWGANSSTVGASDVSPARKGWELKRQESRSAVGATHGPQRSATPRARSNSAINSP